MQTSHEVLSPSAARHYYDRFGKKQDSQGFYEDPAIDELIAHAGFGDAQSVYEFGCGTGRFAARLLERELPASACYRGCDISPVMIGLAQQRLAPYDGRAKVALSDGPVQFTLADQSVDRVVANYVLDLLSENDIRRFFAEAHRVLTPHGRLCLASLTTGVSLPSRTVSSLWTAVFNLNPAIVGGCRPIDPEGFADPRRWRRLHRGVVTPFGVPSEVLVLEAAEPPERAGHAHTRDTPHSP